MLKDTVKTHSLLHCMAVQHVAIDHGISKPGGPPSGGSTLQKPGCSASAHCPFPYPERPLPEAQPLLQLHS